MEFTFANVLLFLALVVVCFLLGFREGGRHGYAIGHADGLFAGQDYIKGFLTDSEIKAVEEREKELAKNLFGKYMNHK